MKRSYFGFVWAAAVLAVLAMSGSPAFAQGGSTATLTGTVVDTSGAVVPGADVLVKNVATGTTYTAVSGSDGGFTIPSIPPRFRLVACPMHRHG